MMRSPRPLQFVARNLRRFFAYCSLVHGSVVQKCHCVLAANSARENNFACAIRGVSRLKRSSRKAVLTVSVCVCVCFWPVCQRCEQLHRCPSVKAKLQAAPAAAVQREGGKM